MKPPTGQSGRFALLGFSRLAARLAADRLGIGGEDWLACRSLADVRAANLRAGDLLIQAADLADRDALRRIDATGVRRLTLVSGPFRCAGEPPLAHALEHPDAIAEPQRPARLERLLAQTRFSDQERQRAAALRRFIADAELMCGVSGPRRHPRWPHAGRPVVLVAGQASGETGGLPATSDADMVAMSRRAFPDAFLVYRPAPDGPSGSGAPAGADHVESEVSLAACLAAADTFVTLASPLGFDALMRGKPVITHGAPFYAGWGLSDDRAAQSPVLARRRRRLDIDELTAGVLLRYCHYYDWRSGRSIECEEALRLLLADRTRRELASPLLTGLKAALPDRLLHRARGLTVGLRLWWRLG